MSDTNSAQGQDTGTSTAYETDTAPVGAADQSTEQPAQKSLYEEYLADIDDEVQRKLLEPRVKDWDARVTKRFQAIHEEYKPYKESGLTAQSIGQAAQLYQMLQSDPQRVFYTLAEALPELAQQLIQERAQQYGYSQQPVQPQVQPQGNGQAALDPYADLDPTVAQHLQSLQERHDKQTQLLSGVAQYLYNQQQQQTTAQQDAQLDFLLQGLRQQYGDYDENYVLTMMHAGMNPDQAVQQWKQTLQQAVNNVSRATPQEPGPPFLGGGSAPPGQQFDPATATSKDVQALVASALAANQQA